MWGGGCNDGHENYLSHFFLTKYLTPKGGTCHFLNYVIAFPWELNVPGATCLVIFRDLTHLQCGNHRKYIPFRT